MATAGAGRADEAELVRQQREQLELPKARLVLVVDQLEELFRLVLHRRSGRSISPHSLV